LMKFSWAVSLVRYLYETDVLRAILVLIIRDLICQQSPWCLIYNLTVGLSVESCSYLCLPFLAHWHVS